MKIEKFEVKVPSKSGKKTYVVKQYALYPSEDYILINKLTGLEVRNFVVVQSESEIANYEEVEDQSFVNYSTKTKNQCYFLTNQNQKYQKIC